MFKARDNDGSHEGDHRHGQETGKNDKMLERVGEMIDFHPSFITKIWFFEFSLLYFI